MPTRMLLRVTRIHVFVYAAAIAYATRYVYAVYDYHA